MMAIFDNLAAAELFVAECDEALGLPRAGVPADAYPRGWTLTWDAPRKHPTEDQWAVEVARGVAVPDGSVESLDAAWAPDGDR